MSRADAAQVKWLISGGEEGFVAPEEWRGKLTREGVRCSHCEGIRPDAKDKLEQVVVVRVPPKRVIDSISSLWAGQVLRCDLIDVIGRRMLEELCIIMPVRDQAGTEVSDFRFLMERSPRGVFRGMAESKIGLCQECGRLLYWPMGKRYLLKRYWDGSGGVTVMNNEVLCTPEYFREILGPRRFPRLKAETRSLADAPQDGLPADYHEMIAAIKDRGLTR